MLLNDEAATPAAHVSSASVYSMASPTAQRQSSCNGSHDGCDSSRNRGHDDGAVVVVGDLRRSGSECEIVNARHMWP